MSTQEGGHSDAQTQSFSKDRQSKNRLQADRISNAPLQKKKKVIYSSK